MESTGFWKQINRRIVIYLALAIFIYGAVASFYSPQAKKLIERKDTSVNFLIHTDTPLFISYNPKYRKAVVTSLRVNKKDTTPGDILKRSGIAEQNILYIKPFTAKADEFWTLFKNNLYGWPKQPYKIFPYFVDYIKLRINGRTNISTADFIAISLDLQAILPTDFSVKANLPQQVKRKGRNNIKEQDAGPEVLLAQNLEIIDTSPILIEVLNASGKSGLAAKTTRYLRHLNNQGTLNLDVINFSNAPSIEKKTKIIDLSGRVADLKNVAKYIGAADTEIFRENSKTAIVEAKIILGEDFVLPKTQNK